MMPYTENVVPRGDFECEYITCDLWVEEDSDEAFRPFALQSAINYAPRLLHEHNSRFVDITPTETRRVQAIPSTYGTFRLFKVVLRP